MRDRAGRGRRKLQHKFIRLCTAGIALLFCFTVHAADGVALTVQRGPGGATLELTWTGGQPLFQIYRGTDPGSLILPENLAAKTSDRMAVLPLGTGFLEFFIVTSPCIVDPPERCDGIDNDCNGEIDGPGSEGSCALDHVATHSCVAGACVPETCQPGFGDCDSVAFNGCEANLLTDPDNCTLCGVSCSVPHGTAACDGACTIASCETGWLDCDGLAGNGCEIDSRSDSGNCGECGIACTVLHGTGVCSAGTCTEQVAACDPDWWNLRESAPGCEYHCVYQSSTDLPDGEYADANCDGIDGTIVRAVFVSTAGDDSNPGSMALPVRTLTRGLQIAQASGKDHLYVQSGTYLEHLNLISGISIWGKFGGSLWVRPDSSSTVSALYSSGAQNVAVSGSDIVQPTTLADMRIDAGPASVPAGTSVYGVHCLRCSGLVLERNIIQAGNAAPGPAGTNGTSGANGTPGGKGGPGDCDANGSGGPGGTAGTSACGRTGGAGGKGGNSGAYNGSPGQTGLGGSVGGSGGAWGDPGEAGGYGTGGVAGGSGVGGAGGAGGGVIGGYWKGSGGGNGSVGGNGNGGGGGGGGGGQSCFLCDDGPGNGGGGGGGGGCGGAGGTGGTAGGGSFGVFIVDSTGTVVQNCQIVTGFGGTGGQGGNGGSSGTGGAGGQGGMICTSEVGAGGAGGRGGNGGLGGPGGGGAGGPAVGIYRVNSTVTILSNTYSIGGGGAGGGSLGNPGQPGETAQVH